MPGKHTKMTQSKPFSLKKKFSRIGLVFLMIPGMINLSGCYGSFPLTGAIYDINGDVTNNTIVHSIVMIVFAIFGVYGISILLDALILNSVEFWSGDEIHIGQSTVQPDGSVVAIAPGEAPNIAYLTITKDNELIAKRRMVRDENGVTSVYDEKGNFLSTVKPDNEGGFEFYNENGNHIGGITEENIAALKT